MAFVAMTTRSAGYVVPASEWNQLIANDNFLKTKVDFIGARAHLSATLTTTVENVETLIHLDHEDYDVGADFDAATSHLYTVPVAGYYLVMAQVAFGDSHGAMYSCRVLDNAAAYVVNVTGTEPYEPGKVYVTGSNVLHFNAAQTLGLYYYQDGSTLVDIEADLTWLAVILLSVD
jgi:hypothetical protein